MITLSARRVLLTEIRQQWLSLPETARPWGVWIREYPVIPATVHEIPNDAWPEHVWFMDNDRLRLADVWAWRRFVVVHSEQPWCTRGWQKEPVGIFGSPHQIGFAAFAPYANNHECYLETIWGSTSGQGVIIEITDGTIEVKKRLWVS